MVIYVGLYFVWLAMLAIAAWQRAAWPERADVGLLILASLVTIFVRSNAGAKYHNVEVGVLLVDLALLAGFMGVALRADRWWPLFLTALQMIVVAGHVGKMVTPMSPLAYALMIGLPSYPQLMVLTWGVATRSRAIARASRRSLDAGIHPTRQEQPHD